MGLITTAVISAAGSGTTQNLIGSVFGSGRDAKRDQRDQAMQVLYGLGMNSGIVPQHSDHAAWYMELANMAQQRPNVVIPVINEIAGRDGRIYSRNSQQAQAIRSRIAQTPKSATTTTAAQPPAAISEPQKTAFSFGTIAAIVAAGWFFFK